MLNYCYLIAGIISFLFMAFYMFCLKRRRQPDPKILLLVPVLVFGFTLYLIGYLPSLFGINTAIQPTSASDYVVGILRALASTSEMLAGIDKYGDIQNNSAIFKSNSYLIPFWIVHTLAFLITILAAITVFGRSLMDKFRKLFHSSAETYIIYGVNQKSLCLGQEIMCCDKRKGHITSERFVVFVDDSADDISRQKIFRMGALLLSDPMFSSDEINSSVLRKAGIFKNKKNAYIIAFTDSDVINFSIANGVWDVARRNGLSTEKLRGIFIYSDSSLISDELESKKTKLQKDYLEKLEELVLQECPREFAAIEKYKEKDLANKVVSLENVLQEYRVDLIPKVNALLQRNNYRYSFNFFCEEDLAARKLLNNNPVYRRLIFNHASGFVQKGPSQNNPTITVVIVGFGKTGKHILRQMLIRGRFLGSTFHAVIFDKQADDMKSAFMEKYPSLFNHDVCPDIKIDFCAETVGNGPMYHKLRSLIETNGGIDYVVTCMGDDNLNFEVISAVRRFLARQLKTKKDLPALAAHIADKNYQLFNNDNESIGKIDIFGQHDELFTRHIIINEEMDELAKLVNSVAYRGRDWATLSMHERNSSRAAAEFLGAYFHILGFELVTGAEKLRMKENGRKYKIVDEEKIEEIFQRFEQNMKEPGRDLLLENLGVMEHLRWNMFHFANGWLPMPLDSVNNERDRKNPDEKTHACLVSWEALGDVGLKTNQNEDYYRSYDKEIVAKAYQTVKAYNQSKKMPESRKLYLLEGVTE